MMYEELIKERLTTLNQVALDWFDYDEDLPKLTWDLKGTVGGQAYLNQNMIRINMEALDAQKAARENAQKARSVTPDLYVSPQSNLEASTPTPHFQQLCPRPKGSPAKENTELPTASIITYL